MGGKKIDASTMWNSFSGKKKEWGNETYVTLSTMLHVHLVTLIIDPSFSCPVSTRLLYIVGSHSSCLWSPFEINIQNRIDDELSEFTWFNEETYPTGKGWQHHVARVK